MTLVVVLCIALLATTWTIAAASSAMDGKIHDPPRTHLVIIAPLHSPFIDSHNKNLCADQPYNDDDYIVNIFCGARNCYDVLELERDSTNRDVKKAYRKLSLIHHPDKSKEANATEIFRQISKAYEVLESNESRSLFDYYLDNPRDYFKVSGQHYYRILPKSDYHYQNSKHQRVVKFLYLSTLHNISEKQGGSKQTAALYTRAVEEYDREINEGKANNQKIAVVKSKLSTDPLFDTIVKRIVAEVDIEGGYRKPKWSETLAIQIFYFPWTFYKWAKKYHRRNISTVPFTDEEKEEITAEVVGLGAWAGELSDAQRAKLLSLDLWKPENKAKWEEMGMDMLLDPDELAEIRAAREAEELGVPPRLRKKAAKKMKKRIE